MLLMKSNMIGEAVSTSEAVDVISARTIKRPPDKLQ